MAVALGVFIGCSPAVGMHGAIALGAATLFRLSRLWCFLGSRISSIVILPWIVMAEVELAHFVREGSWLHLSREELVAQRHHLMLDWILGWFPIGIGSGVFFGALAALAFSLKKRANHAR